MPVLVHAHVLGIAQRIADDDDIRWCRRLHPDAPVAPNRDLERNRRRQSVQHWTVRVQHPAASKATQPATIQHRCHPTAQEASQLTSLPAPHCDSRLAVGHTNTHAASSTQLAILRLARNPVAFGAIGNLAAQFDVGMAIRGNNSGIDERANW